MKGYLPFLAPHSNSSGVGTLTGLFRRKRFWLAAALGVTILIFTFQHANLPSFLNNLRNIRWGWASLVLACSTASYLFIGAVLHRLLQISNQPLRFSTVMQISLISCTLNYLMALGGLSGVAAKVYMLSKKRIPASKTLSISMVHGFLTNTVAIILIFFGFFFLYSKHKLSSRELGVGILILLFAFGMTWVTIQVIVDAGFRRRLWRVLIQVTMAVSRRLRHQHWVHPEKAEAFFVNFDNSIGLLSSNARMLLGPAGYGFLDWLCMFFTLKCAFLAANYPVSNQTLLVGFSVGIFASLFSLTPASLGIMEGSMAGSFYLMGCDYERALLATLVYRLVYFILPMFVSAFFYRQFFPSSMPTDTQLRLAPLMEPDQLPVANSEGSHLERKGEADS
jgi:hypothetical protein